MPEKKYSIAVGIVSSKRGTQGYPSVEYDTHDLEHVISDLKRLQRKFELGNCVLIQTRKGYHAHFFWDNKRSWDEVVRIINDSNAPEDFKKISEDLGFRVLRVSGKYKNPDLKVVGIIESEFNGHGSEDLGNLLFGFFGKLMNIRLPHEFLK